MFINKFIRISINITIMNHNMVILVQITAINITTKTTLIIFHLLCAHPPIVCWMLKLALGYSPSMETR